MTADFLADPVRLSGAAAALAGVLALIALLAWMARRLGLGAAGPRPGRRLALVEVLALDPRRRLVLVRCDGREALLLTGGGGQDALLGWLPTDEEPQQP